MLQMKKNKQLHHDLHFWLGAESTQDEMGTAAYKTVELDDFLGRDAPQYREVQGYETPRFHTYFPNGIKLMAGGIGTGFHHVKPEEYVPKLFHIYGKARIHCEEVKLISDSLNDSDAFVLDGGLKIYIWLGKSSTKTEMFRSTQIANELKESRKGASVEQLNHDGSEEFWKILGGKKDIKKS